MSWSVAAKLWAGYGVLLATLAGSAALIAHAIHSIDVDVRTITQQETPTSAATYEMEINMLETGIDVLHYRISGDPRYRRRVAEEAAEFFHFKASTTAWPAPIRSRRWADGPIACTASIRRSARC